MNGRCTLVALATKGSGSNDERRLAGLLSGLDARLLPFDRQRKVQSFARLLAALLRQRPDLVVMEGTGVAGGAACLMARLLAGVPYVVSSGDAVAPYLASKCAWLGPAARLYEKLLYRLSAGFVGWTPYLVGRALTLGAPRGVTAEGWAADVPDEHRRAQLRRQTRALLGIPQEALVWGIAGSLNWNRRFAYCYGAELARAIVRTSRDDLRVLIVGGGSGLHRLRDLAANDPAGRIICTGPVPENRVLAHLCAMDVGSLPQSVDGVGSFRYTTKISEYRAAGLPVVTGQTPMGYDLDAGWLWRLPGRAPWDERYIQGLARLMQRTTAQDVARRRAAWSAGAASFDRQTQAQRVASFIRDLLADRPNRSMAQTPAAAEVGV